MGTKDTTLKDARVKAGPADGLAEGEFLVYPSTFTKTPDSYGDIVAKGAFVDTIGAWKASGDTLPGLFGHRMDDPDYYVASAVDMGEDDHGWWVKGQFDMDNPKAVQTYRLVKGRRLTKLSFSYRVLDQAPVELDGGVKANELRKLDVIEFSFVPIPANPDTSVVAVKDAAEALEVLAKAGRVLSAKNETALRDARDAIDAVLKSLDGEAPKAAPSAASDDTADATSASGHEPAAAPDAAPDQGGSKAASPTHDPSVFLGLLATLKPAN